MTPLPPSALTCPAWVQLDANARRSLRFVWDDARVDADFRADAVPLLDQSARLSVRARMALAVALYEWLVWRFDGLQDRPDPVQVLEASWCATVDPRYLVYFELERDEWVGPIDGPLWCGMTHLSFGLNNGVRHEGDLYGALSFLYRLVMHVLPQRDGFQQWLDHTLKRLAAVAPPIPSDPLDDLFDQRVGEQLGPLFGRPTFDPGLPRDESQDRAFLAGCFTESLATANPYLATPGDLRDLDFEGEPYRLP
ncbi:hypothetical protein [Roseateles amylovorans]|uniref:Uncharacterized protein n=1 Tax=Roseateles amylovorans TaxID=2978473 RepID=A0ABY6B5J8_9BURK|nr:hypothetical protein [Roseateles amylovorans]UXH80653.1 hypothetical protein N4261_12570 [Roseateles amylovorans]